MPLSDNALKIAKDRYFKENENWEACCRRVGIAAAANERQSEGLAENFSEMIYDMKFIPGGRILRNSGKHRGSLFNCYHLPLGDSIEDIGQTYKEALILWSSGGGVGINASFLRPKGYAIQGKGGKSSGVVSFLEALDKLASTVESGGSRRAAALAQLDVSHPEIYNFIDAKMVENRLNQFNISVSVNSDFINAVKQLS